MNWNQEEVEKQIPLRLVGLAVMANPLRPCSAGVIRQLQNASIRTVMVTGVRVLCCSAWGGRSSPRIH